MLFKAEISDYRIVYNVLKSMSFKDYAVFRPTDSGLKITLEDMKHTETSAYIPSVAFNSYLIKEDEEFIFKISFKVFVECLNIYGDDGNCNVKMSYKEPNAPLCLIIKHAEENITTDCEIRTVNADDFDDESVGEFCNVNKIVIQAKIFEEMLQRLDHSADDIQFVLSQNPPYFTLSSQGVAGVSEVNIPKYAEAVTIFECKEPFKNSYAFTHIRQILKVMHFASKVQISTGSSGLLGLELIIDNGEDKQLYVEFYVSPQFEVDE